MTAFDPSKHPRGNQTTGHSGQFAAKAQTGSEVGLYEKTIDVPMPDDLTDALRLEDGSVIGLSGRTREEGGDRVHLRVDMPLTAGDFFGPDLEASDEDPNNPMHVYASIGPDGQLDQADTSYDPLSPLTKPVSAQVDEFLKKASPTGSYVLAEDAPKRGS